jgi:hypothetical protein
MILVVFAGCTRDGDGETKSEVTSLNVYAFTDEVPGILQEYVKLKGLDEDFFNVSIVATDGGAYQLALDEALVAGEVDLFCAEAAFIKKYAENPLVADVVNDLGISQADMNAAGLAPYTIQVGTNSKGEIKGLSFQACGGAFIYRADIAEDILGTSDPDEIGEMTNTWAKFFEVGAKLANFKDDKYPNGVAIVSGDGDLYHSVEFNKAQPWVVDGKLVVDEVFYSETSGKDFFDLSKKLAENQYSNLIIDW